MVGLDAAGKTTILYKLKLGEIVTTIPTIGWMLIDVGEYCPAAASVVLQRFDEHCWMLNGKAAAVGWRRCCSMFWPFLFEKLLLMFHSDANN